MKIIIAWLFLEIFLLLHLPSLWHYKEADNHIKCVQNSVQSSAKDSKEIGNQLNYYWEFNTVTVVFTQSIKVYCLIQSITWTIDSRCYLTFSSLCMEVFHLNQLYWNSKRKPAFYCIKSYTGCSISWSSLSWVQSMPHKSILSWLHSVYH